MAVGFVVPRFTSAICLSAEKLRLGQPMGVSRGVLLQGSHPGELLAGWGHT